MSFAANTNTTIDDIQN